MASSSAGGLTVTVTKTSGAALDAAMACSIATDGDNLPVALKNTHATDSLPMVMITIDLGWTGDELTAIWQGQPCFKRLGVPGWLFDDPIRRFWLLGSGYPKPGLCQPCLVLEDGNKALGVS